MQDNCSAIARHLFAHVKDLRFETKVEVAEWCQKNISIDIIRLSLIISLIKVAGQKSYWLCATERIIIDQNLLGSTGRRKKILNLKSEMCGVCRCKTRFLWFARSNKEGGLWWGRGGKAWKSACGELDTEGCIFFERCLCHLMGNTNNLWQVR